MLSQDFSVWLEADGLNADSAPTDSRMHEKLSDLRKIVSAHPVARLEIAADGFVLHPRTDDGFTIKVIPTSDRPIIAFAGWHDELDWDVCQDYIKGALAGNLRVRVEALKEKPCKWTLEVIQPGSEWAELASMGYIRLNFWKRDTKTYYFQYPRDSGHAKFKSTVQAARHSARLG